ncbi:MAG: hypothetical protein ABJA93_03535 [Sporichthyaceae bacterium]
MPTHDRQGSPPAHPTSRRRFSARLLIALLLVLAGTLTLVQPASAAPTRARSSYSRAIEPFARYAPQIKCTPRARPGVVNFSRRVLRAYPGTRSLGIVRACSVGGLSEHKEGRAWDWGGLNAHRAADRRKVANLAAWLFATDRHGNRAANARRLGIQYIIWNGRIWGSYRWASGWRYYSGANRHTDHVHISFTWAGANMNTSFWTGRVGGVNWTPAPTPPTPPKPPVVPAPRPEPVGPSTLPAGPELTTETVRLYATSEGVTTIGGLVEGQPYQIEATGTYHYNINAYAKADAECSRTPSDSSWIRDRSVHPLAPTSDHLDLYVDGVDLHGVADGGTVGDCDTTNHVYRSMYTPARSGRVTFALWDPSTRSDNSGSLSIRVIKSAPADVLTWEVRANIAGGITSPGALVAGETYTATITGVVDTGAGVTSDTECSATADDPVWRRQRAVLNGDDFDVLVDRVDVRWEPVSQPDPAEACDSVNHSYTTVLHPTETRPVNIRVGDTQAGDNTGSLQVRVERVVPVLGSETVEVDSADPAGATTARVYPPGVAVAIRVQGTYDVAPGITADAECSTTTADPFWRSSRTELTSTTGQALGDLTVAGQLLDWRTASGSRCDSVDHSYFLVWTPQTTGPIALAIADEQHTDNTGKLTVTVEAAA